MECYFTYLLLLQRFLSEQMGTFEGTVNDKSSPARLSPFSFRLYSPHSWSCQSFENAFYLYWLNPHLSTMCLWILPISFLLFCLRGGLFCGEEFL